MKRLSKFFLILMFFCLSPCAVAGVSEAEVKSAFVLNFSKFTKWPAGVFKSEDRMVLCVMGNNVLDGALFNLEDRKVKNVRIKVERYLLNAKQTCHILFIGDSEADRIGSVLKIFNGSPVLLVSDVDSFAGVGGAIGLNFKRGKVLFEVNLVTLKKSGLVISGQLLNLASHVIRR